MKRLRWTTHDTTRFQTLMRGWADVGDFPEELERLIRKRRGMYFSSKTKQQVRKDRRMRRLAEYVCR